MKFPLFISMVLFLASAGSCSRPSSFLNDEIDNAERIMQSDIDSAMSILDAVDRKNREAWELASTAAALVFQPQLKKGLKIHRKEAFAVCVG